MGTNPGDRRGLALRSRSGPTGLVKTQRNSAGEFRRPIKRALALREGVTREIGCQDWGGQGGFAAAPCERLLAVSIADSRLAGIRFRNT
jgi:hypothetical protein